MIHAWTEWRRQGVACVAALLIVPLFACWKRTQPDVVLVTVDTLRADRLGAYGCADAHTPNLDALAHGGRLFLEATTPFPRTSPAVASLLTGLAPEQHGSREVGEPMDDGVHTLAEMLSAAGWATRAVSANLAAGSRQGLHRGFAAFAERSELPSVHATHVTDRALALARRTPPWRPLFLWAHYADPHFPYAPPADFEGLPDAAETEPCRTLQQVVGSLLARGLVDSNWDGRAEAARAACQRLYDAEVAYVDREIGRLLDGLRGAGRLDRALVVFTSDHGENMGEAGLYYEHGPSVNDAALRVPLVFSGAGVVPGVDRGVARLEDVVPTVLEWVGAPRLGRAPLAGASLAPRLRGEPPRSAGVAYAEGGRAFHLLDFRRLFSGPGRVRCLNGARYSLCRDRSGALALYEPRVDPRLKRDLSRELPEERRRLEAVWARWRGREARERSARTPRFKLVERPAPDGDYTRSLYDLRADPGESVDVSGEHPELAARLARQLTLRFDSAPRAGPKLGRSELELLRRLGYVD